jgi:hypothetical protein
MAVDTSSQNLAVSHLDIVRSTVMIDNDTQKQREKKKKQKDEDRPGDTVELSIKPEEGSASFSPEPKTIEEPVSSPTLPGVKIDILAQ